MNFLEKDLEDIIYNTDNAKLRERGLPIYGIKLRQVRLGSYGVADLVTIQLRANNEKHPDAEMIDYFGHKLIITVYELKLGLIGYSALGQCVKYSKAIEEIVNGLNYQIYDIYDYELNHVLIGSKIDTNSDFCYLININDIAKAYIYDYGFDGISFNRSKGWYRPNGVKKIIDNLNKEPF